MPVCVRVRVRVCVCFTFVILANGLEGLLVKPENSNKNQIMNASTECECQTHDQFSRKYMEINQPIWGQKTAEVQQSMVKGYSRLKRPIARNVFFSSFFFQVWSQSNQQFPRKYVGTVQATSVQEAAVIQRSVT